ncbi:hypothetical protein [Halomonas urumqiensis]|uniref:Uncharacterized protein n=1 Tax=Halomonas urumqiensis TaxID=1684789 RepID=A0A2N7ULD3_9GAMM|nr:hypothetical protein [Halomonas urumqiensis]PMR81238.1 hypothetical protein C1H70_05875 [Halomonas urumqiensis]PTB01751.1 hypothetical protein C6V82_13835 [Halomonas urumqiensis]GHE22149.1 hypothetical protein GCM10017767_26700 [Halomonas urumqiensis]
MRLWPLPLLLVLAGCQTAPTELPVASPAPAAECRWQATDASPQESLRRSVSALEAEGFLIRHTDLTLGLVSAERTRILPGYGDRYDPWERAGMFGSVGVGGGRGGVASGVMIGFGGVGSLTRDATQLERVSVLSGEADVRVSRDIQLIDWRGELVESRNGSDSEFCQRLRQGIGAGGAS